MDVTSVVMLASRLSFYPTLIYNVFMERISVRQWYNRIDNTVILGAIPSKQLAKNLAKEENVKGVVSLNEDYELQLFAQNKDWSGLGVEFLQLRTLDIFCAPTQENLDRGVEFINRVANTGGSVYVHCKAGRTRSATLVACYLIKKYKLSIEEAVEKMKEKRPHIWLRNEQNKALQQYYQTLEDS